MDLKVNIDLRNKYKIEVRDIRTGEITQEAKAENIVLDQYFEMLGSEYPFFGQILHFGSGTTPPAPSDTSLEAEIGYLKTEHVEMSANLKMSETNFRTTKTVIDAGTHTGAVISEVGMGGAREGSGTDRIQPIVTRALLTDAEGNPISIGPISTFEEVTIYSTFYSTVNAPEGFYFDLHANYRGYYKGSYDRATSCLFNFLLGTSSLPNAQNYDAYDEFRDIVVPTGPIYNRKVWGSHPPSYPSPGVVTYPRFRLTTSMANMRIRELHVYSLVTIRFPNSLWSGYNFIDKFIGTGDGIKTVFELPWSDIEMDKDMRFMIDGSVKTPTVDNTEELTTIAFTNPPPADSRISGDWWVGYVPKDETNILDIWIELQFGRGV